MPTPTRCNTNPPVTPAPSPALQEGMQSRPLLQPPPRPPAPPRRVTPHELRLGVARHATLAPLLFPALGKAKSKAQAAGCLSNLKQLQVCWQLYGQDHGEHMPGNVALDPADMGNRGGWSADRSSWLRGNAWSDLTPTNIENGVLFPYNRSLALYRCPADKSTVRDQGRTPRTRSISMSMYMNFRPDPTQSEYDLCWHRTDQIPHPAKAAVFIDEHEKSIQQSAFGINAPDYLTLFGTDLWTWISFPATRHGHAATLSFADGHAELWRWLEPNTALTARRNDWLVLQPAVPKTDRDLGRLFQTIPEKVPIR